ncbi:hypothetical protein MHBO_002401 [Bonamia ostreae]|uniref:Uncharacterized protein n=1 Tax=Bonamia ostreae TaxID=126728 RepID=A0ABV2AM65_9EUKA
MVSRNSRKTGKTLAKNKRKQRKISKKPQKRQTLDIWESKEAVKQSPLNLQRTMRKKPIPKISFKNENQIRKRVEKLKTEVKSPVKIRKIQKTLPRKQKRKGERKKKKEINKKRRKKIAENKLKLKNEEKKKLKDIDKIDQIIKDIDEETANKKKLIEISKLEKQLAKSKNDKQNATPIRTFSPSNIAQSLLNFIKKKKDLIWK